MNITNLDEIENLSESMKKKIDKIVIEEKSILNCQNGSDTFKKIIVYFKNKN